MLEEKLTERVERIIRTSKNRKGNKVVIPPNLFLDMLNRRDEIPEFRVCSYNRRAMHGMFAHTIKYKGHYLISATHTRIYDSDLEFNKTDLLV